MPSLVESAQVPAIRAKLVQDISTLIDRRVASVRGVSGVAIRTGYKVVSRMKGGRMIPAAVQRMLNDFCAALDPFVQTWQSSDARDFAAHLRGREHEVSHALLAITDARAARANKVLQRPYAKLRSFGEKQVAAAVPDIAVIVEDAVTL